MAGAHLGQRVVRGPAARRAARRGAGADRTASWSSRRDGLVVGDVEVGVGRTAEHRALAIERDPLAQVVEGGQLADDRLARRRAGAGRRRARRAGARPRARRRSRGSPSRPPCSGRQLGRGWATGRRAAGPRGRRACPGRAGRRRRQRAVDGDLRPRAARTWPTGRGRRTTSGSSARRARPTRAGSRCRRRRSRAKAATGVIEVGQQLTPDRDDGVARAARAWNSSPARASASSRHASPKRAVEAGVLAGVAGAVALLLDDEQQRVAVAVVERLRAPTGARPTSRPCATPPGGCGSRTPCGPLERAAQRRRRSSTPSSAPGRCPASCTMAGTSPSAL